MAAKDSPDFPVCLSDVARRLRRSRPFVRRVLEESGIATQRIGGVRVIDRAAYRRLCRAIRRRRAAVATNFD